MNNRAPISLDILSSLLETSTAPSIEQGYFIFTLMPSLRCEFNCPHCYLSLDQRRDETVMPLVDISLVCERIDEYYRLRKLPHKEIVCYWYGGEPTTMGIDYVENAIRRINSAFPEERGYNVKHVFLTSLINVDSSWYRIFNTYCNGYLQSSYDGLMRGSGYLRKWKISVQGAVDSGLKVATISVVNEEILKQGPEETLDYLTELGIHESSWLPFMWNEQNDQGSYQRYAPSMNEYSSFMIRLTAHYHSLIRIGKAPPMIGQREFILRQGQSDLYSNIAGQTLFLLPNGDFALPDYRRGYQEYLRVFGNGIKESFDNILQSSGRRDYLRKQLLRDNNPECLDCPHTSRCIMEFWKKNRQGDDCFGARRYVEWLLQNESLDVISKPSCAKLS